MNLISKSFQSSIVKITMFTIVITLLFMGCEKDKTTISNPAPDNLNGVFVVNEGQFGNGNGTISFLSSDSSYFTSDLYTTVNPGASLGNVVQSMTIYSGKAYIVSNVSAKVEIASMTDFKNVGTISGLTSPRFFLGKGTTGYISDWTSNKIQVVNLSTNSIVKSIDCGQGPEEMAFAQGKIFVCNSGGFADDSSITVIDATTNTVIQTIQTPWNPSSIKTDINGKLWVLCRGSLGSDFNPTPDDAPGALIMINPTTNTIEKTFTFNYDQHPIKLQTNPSKDILYFLMGNFGYSGIVMSTEINSNTTPNNTYINEEFYGLGVHPTTGKIYGGRTNFSSNAYMLRFNQDGSIIDSILVGIGPNSFVFN